MSGVATRGRFACAHCTDTFSNAVARYRHVRSAHPAVKRPAANFYPLVPPRGPRADGSLKRDTDTWPGKP